MDELQRLRDENARLRSLLREIADLESRPSGVCWGCGECDPYGCAQGCPSRRAWSAIYDPDTDPPPPPSPFPKNRSIREGD